MLKEGILGDAGRGYALCFSWHRWCRQVRKAGMGSLFVGLATEVGIQSRCNGHTFSVFDRCRILSDLMDKTEICSHDRCRDSILKQLTYYFGLRPMSDSIRPNGQNRDLIAELEDTRHKYRRFWTVVRYSESTVCLRCE